MFKKMIKGYLLFTGLCWVASYINHKRFAALPEEEQQRLIDESINRSVVLADRLVNKMVDVMERFD